MGLVTPTPHVPSRTPAPSHIGMFACTQLLWGQGSQRSPLPRLCSAVIAGQPELCPHLLWAKDPGPRGPQTPAGARSLGLCQPLTPAPSFSGESFLASHIRSPRPSPRGRNGVFPSLGPLVWECFWELMLTAGGPQGSRSSDGGCGVTVPGHTCSSARPAPARVHAPPTLSRALVCVQLLPVGQPAALAFPLRPLTSSC